MDLFQTIDLIFKSIVLVGGGYLIFFLTQRHKSEVAILKSHIDLLKERTIDKAWVHFENLKKFHEDYTKQQDDELLELSDKIAELKNENLSKDEMMNKVEYSLTELRKKLIHYKNIEWELYLEKSFYELAKDLGIDKNEYEKRKSNWKIVINGKEIELPGK